MSNLKMKGNASGLGTTTLQSANTGSTTTFTLPGTDGASGQLLQTDGSGGLSFGAVNVANGGTGAAALTANNVILGNGTNAVQFAAPGAAGNVLTSDGTTWASAVPGVLLNTAQIFTATQTFRAANAVRSEAASTQDAVVIAGRAGGSNSYAVTLTPATLSGNRTLTLPESGSNETLGYLNLPQNSQSAAYTLVLSDAGKHILHPSADTTARTFTIPANSSVAFPIGTAITFVNQNGAGVVTIAITTDTLRLCPAGSTGSRTLAANGIATCIKLTSTEWIISGSGLT